MASVSGLLAAVERAPRERLVRFVRFADPGQPAWKGDPAGWSDMELRSAALVIGDRFWAIHRARRLARAVASVPYPIPAGCTVIPSYCGASLDAWLARNPALPLPQAAA